MTPASVRAALHERGVLIREVERTGLRRLVFACGAFLGAAAARARARAPRPHPLTPPPPFRARPSPAVKYVKTRFFGASNGAAVLKR